jgi:hypothetical protein
MFQWNAGQSTKAEAEINIDFVTYQLDLLSQPIWCPNPMLMGPPRKAAH